MTRTGRSSSRFHTKIVNSYLRPPSTVPDADLILRPSGLAFSGGKVTTWTAEGGQVFTATSTAEPLEGSPLLNGHAGMLCDVAGGRVAYNDAAIVSGTSSSYSVQITMWPENDVGASDREYLVYFSNLDGVASNHLVFPHQANGVGFNQLGVYVGPNWHYIDQRPTHKPQVLLYTFTAGAARAYRNGVFLDIDHDTIPAAKAFLGMNIGASYGSAPVTEGFKGTIYDVRMWCTTALSTLQAASSAQPRLAEFGIDPDAYYPNDSSPSSITLWVDSRDKRGNGSAEFDGTAILSLWTDQSGNNYHFVQGVGGNRPAQGTRINGRPTIGCVSTRWLASTSLQNLFNTGSAKKYSVMLPVRLHSVTATQATTVYNRDPLLGDVSAFFSVHAFNDSGTPSIGLYHYGLANYILKRPLALDTPALVHAWYDGTNINLRVADGAVASTAAPNVSNLANAIRVGFGTPTATPPNADIAEVLIRNDTDSTIMNLDRGYFGRIYDLDV